MGEYVGKWDLKVETEALVVIFTVNLGLAIDLEWEQIHCTWTLLWCRPEWN